MKEDRNSNPTDQDFLNGGKKLPIGLTDKQVQQRREAGFTNKVHNAPSKTYKRIFADNIFTLFNAINLVLGFLIFSVGSYQNALFLGVVISNTCLGLIQEIRAKHTIEKLSLIVDPHVTVRRNNETREISVEDIVLDDILELKAGSQICSDAKVLAEEGFEVDESLLTGESHALRKSVGDEVLSGSFVVSGSAYVHVQRVGMDNYAAKLAHEARRNKRIRSKLIVALNKIIKGMTFVIVPAGVLLFISQMINDTLSYAQAIVPAVAGVIGMIPEGLILLSTVAFAVGVINLSKHKTLVQALPCIETLARVDVLCLDKTGTITDGSMAVEEVIICPEEISPSEKNACKNLVQNSLQETDQHTERAEMAWQALEALTAVSIDTNPTQTALKRYFGYADLDPLESQAHKKSQHQGEPQRKTKDSFMCEGQWHLSNIIPFSSQRRWSGANFAGSSWILGAPDDICPYAKEIVAPYASQGLRVLALARVEEDIGETLPVKRELYALIVLADTIRPQAADTFRFFADQGVQIKVISGDNALTVSATAQKAGLAQADRYIDMSTVSDDDDWKTLSENYTVFGRVDPYKKKKLIEALRANDHIVGMTGDGVNDVLALKESDCSIAMASGSDAARAVSELVLMESNFSALPAVVHEGRRVINNIEQVAVLYLAKTVYSSLLCFSFILLSFLLDQRYPFVPLNFTLISATCIGIPSFFLALSSNQNRVEGDFLKKTLTKVVPIGFLSALNVLGIHILGMIFLWDIAITSTVQVFVLGSVSLMVLANVCSPLKGKRLYLLISMVILFVVGFTGLGWAGKGIGGLIPWWQLGSITLACLPLIAALNAWLVYQIFSWSHKYNLGSLGQDYGNLISGKGDSNVQGVSREEKEKVRQRAK